MNFVVIKLIVWENESLPLAVIPPHSIAKKTSKEIITWLETRYRSKIKSFKITTH